MSAPQHEWIYLDEDLPEIHIRELISLEELLEKHPNFVAMTEQEIYNQLSLMFQDKPGAIDTYFELHKDVTMPSDKLKAYMKHVVYQVHAKRKDLGTANSIQEYFNGLNSLQKIPNYKVRQQVQAELHDPYQQIEKVENKDTIPVPEKTGMYMRFLDTKEEVVRLNTDKEPMDILAGEFHITPSVPSMYLHESISAPMGRTLERTVPVEIEKLPKDPVEAFEAFTRAIVPSFIDVIKHVSPKNTTDMRSLQVLMEQYGRSLEEIDTDAYSSLVNKIKRMPPITETEESEESEEQKKKKAKKPEPREIKAQEASYVRLHKLFWDSMTARLTMATTDVPIYMKGDLVNEAMNSILEKPFKVEEYIPLSKQLEKLENGSLKLQEYLKDIELLRNLDERILLNDFRTAMISLSGTDSPAVFKELEKRVQESANRTSKTIDPDKAEEMFGSKQFLKTYTEKDYSSKNYVPPEEVPAGDEPGHYVIEELQQLVMNLPENEEDVELEEAENELLKELMRNEKTQLIRHLMDCSDVLSNLQQLTNMPWNPREFVKMLLQRAPDIPDIRILMREIDKTIPENILQSVTIDSIDSVLEILPIEQQKTIKKTYRAALKRDDEYKRQVFFLFITYWILYVQSLMLENLFYINDITNSPCKSELTGLGFPLEEGRAERKGVMAYFVCMLSDEGHDIPNMVKLLDGFSKEEIKNKVREGFERFTHEVDAMKKLAQSEIIYQGSIRVEEADEAYKEMMSFREKKQKFKPNDLLKPYIKSLQLLPGIIEDVKEKHKHILGCCYTRLDSNYLATKNFARIRDGGLSKARRYFANEGMILKKRPLLAHYGKPIPVTEFELPDKKTDKNLQAIEEVAKKAIEAEERVVPWQDEIHSISLIPEKVHDMLNPENRQVIPNLYDEALRYAEALFITTGSTIHKELWSKIQTMTIHELYRITIQVLYSIYHYANILEEMDMAKYETEIQLLRNVATNAKNSIETLRMLQVPDEHSEEIRALWMFVLCRTACLPGDLETGRRITMRRVLPGRFLEDLLKNTGNNLQKLVEIHAMPTMDEITKRITEIREQRKIETIRKFEANPELQKIIKQSRLQGIQIKIEDILQGEIEAEVPQQITEDELADLEGVMENQRQTENPDEADPDDLGDY